MTWDWITTLNATTYKAVYTVWLWVGTFVIWAGLAVLCALRHTDPPTEFLTAWLGALTLFSGVGAYQFKTMRDSDYEALRIKAGANVPASTTTVQSGAVNVAAAQTTDPTPNSTAQRGS